MKNRGSYQRPCAHCSVYTRVEFLVDVSELVPLSGLVCEACEHELVADYHDDPTCTCASCERARAVADRLHREAEAQTRGGLSRGTLVLLRDKKGEFCMESGRQGERAVDGASNTIEHSPEDLTVFAALEYIEAELIGLRNQPLTREAAGRAILAILGHVEEAAHAYGKLEARQGALIQLASAEAAE